MEKLIQDFGGAGCLAGILHLPATTVASWKSRGSIPASYWSDVVAAAEQRHIDGITLEALARLAAAKTPEHTPPAPAPEPSKATATP